MDRVVARPPDGVEELCLVRVGLIARRLRALPFAIRMARAIDRAAAEATRLDAGLLGSERFRIRWDHLGVFQYWSSFEALDAWSRQAPHSGWWSEALRRMRDRGDFGVYHETYLVPRGATESVYLDCPPVGILAFGVRGEAVGSSTTSRDRLGRRAAKG